MFYGKMNESPVTKTHYRTLSAIYDTQIKPYEENININGEKENPHTKSSTFDAEV